MDVLITGSAGGIGKLLREKLAGRYASLRLADRAAAPGDLLPTEDWRQFDLGDIDAATDACQGIDCVVHMAGVSVEPVVNAWEEVLPANIVGCYNMIEASRRAGVKRFIFASSNHVVGFHRREHLAGIDAQPRPDSIYAVSKVFGEALARLYADKHGMSVACLRIGSFRDAPEDIRQLDTWISPDDMVQLVIRCIEAQDMHFTVAYGVSDNLGSYWSNKGVEWLGYQPSDKGSDFAEFFANSDPEEPISAQFHGGSYCAKDFDGDTSKID